MAGGVRSEILGERAQDAQGACKRWPGPYDCGDEAVVSGARTLIIPRQYDTSLRTDDCRSRRVAATVLVVDGYRRHPALCAYRQGGEAEPVN